MLLCAVPWQSFLINVFTIASLVWFAILDNRWARMILIPLLQISIEISTLRYCSISWGLWEIMGVRSLSNWGLKLKWLKVKVRYVEMFYMKLSGMSFQMGLTWNSWRSTAAKHLARFLIFIMNISDYYCQRWKKCWQTTILATTLLSTLISNLISTSHTLSDR